MNELNNKTPGAQLERLLGYVQQDPGNASLRADIFDLALKQGLYEVAQSQLDAMLTAMPGDPHWIHRDAILLIAQHRYAEADQLLSELQEKGYDNPAICFNRAWCAFGAQRLESACSMLNDLVNRPDAPPEALPLLLRCMHRLGQVDEALTLFDRFSSTSETADSAFGVASLLAVDAGRFADARTWSERALRSNSAMLEALVARGSAALAVQDVQHAIPDFEHALRLYPGDGRSWSGLGTAYMLASELEKALQCFQEAVRGIPEHIGTWQAMAWCQLLLHRLADARTSFERALELDRNFGESHGGLAVILALQGHIEEASRHIDLADRLDPQNLSGRYARAVLEGDVQDSERFRKFAERVLKSRTGVGGASLADIVLRRGR